MIEESVFRNVLKTIKEFPDRSLDIIDSFSDNQFKAKENLVKYLDEFLDKDHNLVIIGCWYGSILIPLLIPKVNKIVAIDIDENVIRIGKNRFFKDYKNISWSTGDAFTKQLDYSNTKFVINTSCEHMLPMKEWPYWSKLKSDAYFAFQSNNMFQVAGHINCVNSLEEFKSQLPKNSEVLIEEEIDDSRGIRYMLIGKIS